MNIHILTGENGEIKRYSVDFQPHEVALALNTINKLHCDKIEAPAEITKSASAHEAPKDINLQKPEVVKKGESRLVPAPVGNIKGATTAAKNRESLIISKDNIRIAATYMTPSVKKVFKSINMSAGNWGNVCAKNKISRNLLDKLSAECAIPYHIENGSVIVRDGQASKVEEMPEVKATDNKGVLISYNQGGDIINQWMAGDKERAITKIKQAHAKRNANMAYPSPLNILDIKEMTYKEYSQRQDAPQ